MQIEVQCLCDDITGNHLMTTTEPIISHCNHLADHHVTSQFNNYFYYSNKASQKNHKLGSSDYRTQQPVMYATQAPEMQSHDCGVCV